MIMNLKRGFLFFYYTTAIMACKKEYSLETTPKKQTEVISIGNIRQFTGTSARESISMYWRDSVLFYLDRENANPAAFTYAYRVEKENGKIFTVGFSNDGEFNSPNKPCYWINERIYILPYPNNANRCHATAIKAHKNLIYIVGNAWETIRGQDFEQPLLWVLNNNGMLQKQINLPLPNNAVSAESSFSILQMNDMLIIPGECRLADNSWLGCFWKIDLLHSEITANITDIPIDNAYVFGDAYNNNIYLVGANYNAPSHYIWTKDGHLTPNKPLLPNLQCFANFIIDRDGYFHVIVQHARDKSEAIIWKIDQKMQVMETNIKMPANHSGYCFDIDVKEDEFVYGIVYHEGTTSDPREKGGAFIQKNEMNIPLQLDNITTGLNMQDVKIVEK